VIDECARFDGDGDDDDDDDYSQRLLVHASTIKLCLEYYTIRYYNNIIVM